MLQPLIHYGLHFGVPILMAMSFERGHRHTALYIIWCTMAVDIDHLLASPVFDPDRMSIGFHPLHSYPAIMLYAVCFVLTFILPHLHIRFSWWLRPLSLGLLFHMLTDYLDFVLWH